METHIWVNIRGTINHSSTINRVAIVIRTILIPTKTINCVVVYVDEFDFVLPLLG
jgi:hypothetical protein